MTNPEDEMTPEELAELMVESSATEEQYLRFVAQLRDLVRAEHIEMSDRLAFLDHAIGLLIGGNIVDATDWALKATLGLIEP